MYFSETTDAGVTTLTDGITGFEYQYSIANPVERKATRAQAVEAQKRAIGRIQNLPSFYTTAELIQLAAIVQG